ncbi:BTB domain-containing protein [Meloidogyne graminicola]|uniref:BTB domain-containing protein n=1 Tax=Meloidogyne graminicola TaxID=189291 RepID=A0A8S9ZUE0_9BILA|nr:BTB domain-containing protein [Meloidogyne graminicola]
MFFDVSEVDVLTCKIEWKINNMKKIKEYANKTHFLTSKKFFSPKCPSVSWELRLYPNTTVIKPPDRSHSGCYISLFQRGLVNIKLQVSISTKKLNGGFSYINHSIENEFTNQSETSKYPINLREQLNSYGSLLVCCEVEFVPYNIECVEDISNGHSNVNILPKPFNNMYKQGIFTDCVIKACVKFIALYRTSFLESNEWRNIENLYKDKVYNLLKSVLKHGRRGGPRYSMSTAVSLFKKGGVDNELKVKYKIYAINADLKNVNITLDGFDSFPKNNNESTRNQIELESLLHSDGSILLYCEVNLALCEKNLINNRMTFNIPRKPFIDMYKQGILTDCVIKVNIITCKLEWKIYDLEKHKEFMQSDQFLTSKEFYNSKCPSVVWEMRLYPNFSCKSKYSIRACLNIKILKGTFIDGYNVKPRSVMVSVPKVSLNLKSISNFNGTLRVKYNIYALDANSKRVAISGKAKAVHDFQNQTQVETSKLEIDLQKTSHPDGLCYIYYHKSNDLFR